MDVWKKNTISFFFFFFRIKCWPKKRFLRTGTCLLEVKPPTTERIWPETTTSSEPLICSCVTVWDLLTTLIPWTYTIWTKRSSLRSFLHCPHRALVSLLKWVGRQRIRTSDQHCRHPGKLVLPRYTPGVSDIQKHHWCLSVVSSSAPLPQKRTLSLSKTRNSKVNVKLQQKLLIYFSCNV